LHNRFSICASSPKMRGNGNYACNFNYNDLPCDRNNPFATLCQTTNCPNCDSQFLGDLNKASEWELSDCKMMDPGNYGKKLFCKLKSTAGGDMCLSTRAIQPGRSSNAYQLFPCSRAKSRFSGNYGRTGFMKQQGLLDGANNMFIRVNHNGLSGQGILTNERGSSTSLYSGAQGWKIQLVRAKPAPKCNNPKLSMSWQKPKRISFGREFTMRKTASQMVGNGVKGGMMGGVSLSVWASATVTASGAGGSASASAGASASAAVAADVGASVKAELSGSRSCSATLKAPEYIDGEENRRAVYYWQWTVDAFCGMTHKAKVSMFEAQCNGEYAQFTTSRRMRPKCYPNGCADDVCQTCSEEMYCLNPLDCKSDDSGW